MNSIIAYICLTGLFLPLLILFFNKGYLSVNRYLAGFLFFASLYLLENFCFFYVQNNLYIASFTLTHQFFYLVGPFAFFYVRSILRDNSKLSNPDYLHFALFGISLAGYIPYFFSSWDYKLVIASNILSDNWDMAAFHINKIIPHKLDQLFNVLHTYFYCISLWFLLWHYKKKNNSPINTVRQYKLIKNWLLIFTIFFTIITINFTLAMANMWLFEKKSVFLNQASFALLFAAIIYVGMNMVVMFFPQIMYGLPLSNHHPTTVDALNNNIRNKVTLDVNQLSTSEPNIFVKKKELQLFSVVYLEEIETLLQECITLKLYLNHEFNLKQTSLEIGIPAHHLTYYFNNICSISFSDWRNKLRVDYVITSILDKKNFSNLTLEAIGLQAGFTSNSTFVRAFKNVTGKTPSEYLDFISLSKY